MQLNFLKTEKRKAKPRTIAAAVSNLRKAKDGVYVPAEGGAWKFTHSLTRRERRRFYDLEDLYYGEQKGGDSV